MIKLIETKDNFRVRASVLPFLSQRQRQLQRYLQRARGRTEERGKGQRQGKGRGEGIGQSHRISPPASDRRRSRLRAKAVGTESIDRSAQSDLSQMADAHTRQVRWRVDWRPGPARGPPALPARTIQLGKGSCRGRRKSNGGCKGMGKGKGYRPRRFPSAPLPGEARQS